MSVPHRVSMTAFLATLSLQLFACAGIVRFPEIPRGYDGRPEAASAYGRGDYTTALRIARPPAEQGNAAAQYDLAVLYERGRGVPRDYAEAASWYRKAAEQGFFPAQTNLGSMYEEGRGVAADINEAVAWYRKAAAQGDDAAQRALRRLNLR